MMPPRDPVRVMHLVTGLNVGGAETALLRLLGRMDRRRVESAVVSMIAPGPIAQQLTAIGIEVTALDMTPGRPMPWALARLVRQLRRSQPDVLQTWMYHADLLGTLAAPLSRVPRLAWNIRGSVNAETRRSRALRAVVALCARLSSRPDVIVANSQEGRRSHIVRGYRADGWSVVPNGIDTSQFRPDPEAREATRRALGLSTDTFVVGLVARYDRLKAHSVFLTAAAAMAAVNPVVRFVLVGEGMSADHPVIGAQVRTLGLTDRVLLLGRREDIPALTRTFDVATLPSECRASRPASARHPPSSARQAASWRPATPRRWCRRGRRCTAPAQRRGRCSARAGGPTSSASTPSSASRSGTSGCTGSWRDAIRPTVSCEEGAGATVGSRRGRTRARAWRTPGHRDRLPHAARGAGAGGTPARWCPGCR
jgi:glycosyltransferase involved in cell wall biosynthesis